MPFNDFVVVELINTKNNKNKIIMNKQIMKITK